MNDIIKIINNRDDMPGLSLAQIAEILGADYDAAENMIRDDATVYADDGNAAVAYSGYTPDEAANEYAEEGWGDSLTATTWITVATYRKGMTLDRDGDAESIDYDHSDHKITLHPAEPKCRAGKRHDWIAPAVVVGGLAENPGVFGHGGGVVATKLCRHCGIYQRTDTWAQDPVDGQQGLLSIEYRDADSASLDYIS